MEQAVSAASCAADIAAELRQRSSANKLQLHKLLFYVQCTHLAWEGTPAFPETVEAWRDGPVVASLWRDERWWRRSRSTQPVPSGVGNVISNVLARHSHLSGPQLVALTHENGPWVEITGSDGAKNQSIPHALMAAHGSELSPELAEVRERISMAREPGPFVADAPGDLDRVLALAAERVR